MPDDGACPSKQSVIDEEGVDDAERTAWATVQPKPLCFYGGRLAASLPENSRATFADACADATDTLDELRADYAARFTMRSMQKDRPVSSFESRRFDCTVDGLVIVVEADGPTCDDAEAYQAHNKDSVAFEATLLLAADVRAPYRVRTYDTTFTYDEGCASGGLVAQ